MGAQCRSPASVDGGSSSGERGRPALCFSPALQRPSPACESRRQSRGRMGRWADLGLGPVATSACACSLKGRRRQVLCCTRTAPLASPTDSTTTVSCHKPAQLPAQLVHLQTPHSQLTAADTQPRPEARLPVASPPRTSTPLSPPVTPPPHPPSAPARLSLHRFIARLVRDCSQLLSRHGTR